MKEPDFFQLCKRGAALPCCRGTVTAVERELSSPQYGNEMATFLTTCYLGSWQMTELLLFSPPWGVTTQSSSARGKEEAKEALQAGVSFFFPSSSVSSLRGFLFVCFMEEGWENGTKNRKKNVVLSTLALFWTGWQVAMHASKTFWCLLSWSVITGLPPRQTITKKAWCHPGDWAGLLFLPESRGGQNLPSSYSSPCIHTMYIHQRWRLSDVFLQLVLEVMQADCLYETAVGSGI